MKVALTDRVWGIGYNDVECILVLLHEFKTISNMEGELGTEKPFGHPREVLLRYINDILDSRQHENWWAGITLRCAIGNSNQYSSLESSQNPCHTSSISHRTTDSTSGFFTTSLSTPPSPPPIISTYKKENMLAVETGKITHLEGVALLQIQDLSNTKCEWYLLGGRVAAQWKVGNHLLVGKLIPLCALDHSIQHQDIPIGFTENDVTAKYEAHLKALKSPRLNWQNVYITWVGFIEVAKDV